MSNDDLVAETIAAAANQQQFLRELAILLNKYDADFRLYVDAENDPLVECRLNGTDSVFVTRRPFTARKAWERASNTGEIPHVMKAISEDVVMAAIAAEEELDGDIPDNIYEKCVKSREDAEEVCRAAVRGTKKSIFKRLFNHRKDVDANNFCYKE